MNLFLGEDVILWGCGQSRHSSLALIFPVVARAP